jgi:hypothetical protein
MSSVHHSATAEMTRSEYKSLAVRSEDPVRIFGSVELPIELLEAERPDQELAVQRAVQDLAARLLWHLRQPGARRPKAFAAGPFGKLEKQ